MLLTRAYLKFKDAEKRTIKRWNSICHMNTNQKKGSRALLGTGKIARKKKSLEDRNTL